jgi:hypothetical protein
MSPRALLLVAAVSVANAQHPDAAYYPLPLGTSWSYTVHRFEQERTSKVLWRVTAEDRRQSPPVFQVWPEPMQADDEAMRLRLTRNGIEDVDDGAMMLRFPLTAGAVWTSTPAGGGSHRTYRVLSMQNRCSTGHKQYATCAVVEENDPGTGLRVVITYAREIGPVAYEYYRARSGGETLIQRLTLDEKKDVSAQQHVVHKP